MFEAVVREGLVIKLYEERHAEEIFAVVDRDRDYLSEWLPWPHLDQSPEDVRGFIRNALQRFANNEGPNCGIWEHGQFVGGIGVHPILWADGETSIGYWLAEPAQGRGIITACSRRIIDYLFDDLKLHRVFLEAATGNVKSRAVAERLGMRQEGILREARMVGGRALDMVVYAVLRDEWTALRAGDS